MRAKKRVQLHELGTIDRIVECVLKLNKRYSINVTINDGTGELPIIFWDKKALNENDAFKFFNSLETRSKISRIRGSGFRGTIVGN